MGLTGSLENRSVQTSFSKEELDKYKKICESNKLTSVDDICHYYEKQGVEIDYGCPNLWPIGGPKAKQKEYFECKAAFYENTGTSAGGGGSGSCSSSKNADTASDAQSDAAADSQSANDANSDEAANEAQTADAEASEEAANKANEAVDKAAEIAASAVDSISQKLANMNMLAQGAAALASTALSKIGLFSLPNVEIPEFKLPEINSFIENIKETYNPEAILDGDIKTLMDQLGSIEDIRNKLEGTRLGEALKELADNQKLEDAFLDKLKGLGGAVEAAFDKAGAIDSALSSVMNAAANAGNLAEAVGAAVEAAANGDLMNADTVKGLVDSISEAAKGTDLNAAMKAVFGDSAGKASEALAKADSDNGEQKRGNGPCGGGTRNVGGVNWNDPEEEKGEEDAQSKAYYLKQFEDACATGNMNEVERLYDILINQFGEDPKLLKDQILKLAKTAPQTKAGIARVDALMDKAGIAYNNKASSTSASTIGDGNPELLNNAVNMNKSLIDSKDDAKQLQAAASFVKSNSDADMASRIAMG